MSLINQMLKELEQRQQPQADQNLASGVITSSNASAGRYRVKLFMIIFISMLCLLQFLVILGVTLFANKIPATQQAIVINSKLPEEKSQPISIPTISKPRQKLLKQISVNVEGITTNLLFHLDNMIHYVTNGISDKNELRIRLANVKQEMDINNILPKDSVIEALSATPIGDDLQVNMQLASGTLIKSLVQKDDKLLLKLENNSADKPTASTKQVKTNSIKKVFRTLSKSEKMHRQYQNAIGLVHEGKIEEGVEALTKFINKHPQIEVARQELVMLEMEQHHYAKARDLLLEGMKREPKNIHFPQLLAQILMAQGKAKSALSVLLRSAPSISKDPQYHALIAAAYKDSGHYVEAASTYSALLKIQPDNGLWWLGLGLCMEQLEKYNAAISAYQKASEAKILKAYLRAFVDSRLHTLRG